MNFRAVLFDMDGTLVDTWRLYVESYRKGLEAYYRRSVALEEIISLRPNSEIRMFRRAVGEADCRRILEVFYEHYERFHDELFDGCYRGTGGMLDRLRAEGLRVGIVTGKSRRALEITLRRCDLGPFDVMVADDDVVNLKPDPEGLASAAATLGIDPSECCYIGDSPNDKRAAHGAGMLFGAALWPKSDDELSGYVKKIEELPGESRLFLSPAEVSAYFCR